jgi:hypothetical protein
LVRNELYDFQIWRLGREEPKQPLSASGYGPGVIVACDLHIAVQTSNSQPVPNQPQPTWPGVYDRYPELPGCLVAHQYQPASTSDLDFKTSIPGMGGNPALDERWVDGRNDVHWTLTERRRIRLIYTDWLA